MSNFLSILLIEDETNICENFRSYISSLSDVCLVGITNNSHTGMQYVKEQIPDAIILDLELHNGGGNGIIFLNEFKNANLPFKPYILVTTNNSSSTTFNIIRELGVDFIMSKHEENYSEKNTVDFLRMLTASIKSSKTLTPTSQLLMLSSLDNEKALRRIISTNLKQVGIPVNSLGYTYLTESIYLLITGKSNNICTDISVKYRKTNSSIERAMQNAINKAWRTADIEELAACYTARINPARAVPTLTEFVYYYVDKIKSEL